MLLLWLLPLELLGSVFAADSVTPTPSGRTAINFSNALPTQSAAPFLANSAPLSFVQPLYRGQHARARRRSPVELSDWALREKQRIQGKYLNLNYGDGLSPLAKRQQQQATASFDGAYYASSRSGSSARATATNRNAGRVNLTNYLADLCVLRVSLFDLRCADPKLVESTMFVFLLL